MHLGLPAELHFRGWFGSGLDVNIATQLTHRRPVSLSALAVDWLRY